MAIQVEQGLSVSLYPLKTELCQLYTYFRFLWNEVSYYFHFDPRSASFALSGIFCKLFEGYMRSHILEMSSYLDYKHPFFWDIPLFAFVNDAVLLQLWIT